MESRNITIDPQTTFDKGKAETMTVPLDNMLTRSTRIKKNSDNGNDPVISGGGD